MTLKKVLCSLGAGLCLLGPGQAAALTVDQVIALRRAGISNETIQVMIDTEIKVRAQGGRSGRYVVKQADGSEVIVYQASTPRGVVEYPVPLGPESGGVVQRLSAALDNKPVSAGPAPAAASSKSSSKKTGGYTLHLASFQNQAYAREQLQALKAKGVEARLQGVDLPGRGHWHRLLVGKFSSRSQARTEGDKLRKQGHITSFRVMPN